MQSEQRLSGFDLSERELYELVEVTKEFVQEWPSSPRQTLAEIRVFLDLLPKETRDLALMLVSMGSERSFGSAVLSMQNDEGDFLSWWQRKAAQLSPAARWLFVMTIWPLIINTVSNLTSPKVAELIFTASSDAQVPEALKTMRFSNGKDVHIHMAPDRESAILGGLSRGELVTLNKVEGGWALVRVAPGENDAQIVGWVDSAYLSTFHH